MRPRSSPVRRAKTASLSGTILALLILVVPIVAIAPSAAAQGIFINQRADFTFGWEFPEGELPGPVFEDPADDVYVHVIEAGTTPVPFAALTPHADLRALSLHEIDEERFLIRLQVADLEADTNRLDGTIDNTEFRIRFTVGSHDYTLQVRIWSTCIPTSDNCEAAESVYHIASTSLTKVREGDSEYVGRPPARIDHATETIEVLLPRWAIGRPEASEAIRNLEATSYTFGSIFVSCDSRDGCQGWTSARDQLPDDAAIDEALRFTLESSGATIRLDRPNVDEDEDTEEFFFRSGALLPRSVIVDAQPGEAARIPLDLTNLLTRKIIATGSHAVISGPEDIDVRVPVQVEVPGGDKRRITVTVNTTQTFTIDDPLIVRVKMDAIGTGTSSTDWIDVIVRHIPLLSPENPRLYLHTRDGANELTDNGVYAFSFADGFLSTMAEHPEDDQVGTQLQECCLGGMVQFWETETTLITDRTLDVAERGTLHLAYETDAPGDLLLDVDLFANEEPVVGGATSIALDAGEGTVDIPLIANEESERLPAGAQLQLWLSAEFRPAGVPFGEFAMTFTPEPRPRLLTGGATWLELPLVRTPEVVPGADHLVVGLVDDADPIRYANPGKSATWRVTVLNQGQEHDQITAAIDDLGLGWSADIQPADRYRLGPGESITMGVTLRAPQDAAEGHVEMTNLTISSTIAPGAKSGMPIGAVVTQGVEIEEDTFVADNTTTERAADVDSAETPGVGIMPLLVAGFVVMLRRRRSGRLG